MEVKPSQPPQPDPARLEEILKKGAERRGATKDQAADAARNVASEHLHPQKEDPLED